ncbi:MAG: hypothetical protein JXB36_19680, partial [Gammaproteobacteria bacterium]|nr:hypothetical protein [Gammaproteobacteria bacterium]
FIQTVPKRGYRLVETVVPLAPTGPPGGVHGDAGASSEPPPAELPAQGPPAPGAAVASVAVLPFDNHSIDPAHVFLGDALAVELHSTLARVDRLRVASRRSSFAFRNESCDIRDIGKRLNVDYAISGSVLCDGRSMHVVAELNDAIGGTQVWARSYDRTIEDLLAIEKEIAGEIVGSFATEQLRAEMREARHRSTNSLDAWGLVQKARALVMDYTAEGFAEAIEPLRRAIELDADYPAAHATLSALLVERLVNNLSDSPERDQAAAREAAEKALALAPQDPYVLKMASPIWTWCGEHRKSLLCLRKAVTCAPFDFGAWGYMGWPLTATGDAGDLKELRHILDRLLGMEPQHPGVAFWRYHESVAELCEGRYAAASASAEAAIELRPRLALAWMHHANVLGQQNDVERGRRALERCLELNPALTPQHFERVIGKVTVGRKVRDRRLGGLRRLGALGRGAARSPGGVSPLPGSGEV